MDNKKTYLFKPETPKTPTNTPSPSRQPSRQTTPDKNDKRRYSTDGVLLIDKDIIIKNNTPKP